MKTATFWKSFADGTLIASDTRPMVALLGRSNVGKSSLVNALTQSKGLAHVSATPGRTATINVYVVDGIKLLVDLPGYGYAKTSKANRETFETLIFDYLHEANRDSLRLVGLLIDGRIGVTSADRELIEFLEAEELPFVLIPTKVDGLSNNERALMMRKIQTEYPHTEIFPCSAHTKAGLEELRKFFEEKWR